MEYVVNTTVWIHNDTSSIITFLPRYCNSVNISFWVNVLCTNHFIENREDEAFSYHDRSTTLNSEEGARGSSAPRC